MVNNMLVGGKMENNMEKEHTARMDVIAKEFGKMEKESDGLMTPSGKKCKMLDNHNRRILVRQVTTELTQIVELLIIVINDLINRFCLDLIYF
jgi:hypothetical protein